MSKIYDYLKNNLLAVVVIVLLLVIVKNGFDARRNNKLLLKQIEKQEELYDKAIKDQNQIIDNKLDVVSELQKENKKTTQKIDGVNTKLDKLYIHNSNQIDEKYGKKDKDISNTPVSKTRDILSGNLAIDNP